MIDTLERNGPRLDRPWMLAVGARGRAMLLAAQGDLDAAVQLRSKRWPNTTGCRCRSSGRAPNCSSANFSGDGAKGRRRSDSK